MLFLRNLTTFLLALVAVVFHMPSILDRHPVPDSRKTEYAPLAWAEDSLGRKDYKKSLRDFELAAARAYRCGDLPTFAVIRKRVGGVGLELASAGESKAWSFISWYCIHADDFTMDSANIETWMLDRGLGSHVFEYELIKPDGVRTMLNTFPTCVPLWLYRKFPLLVKLDNFFKTLEIPGIGDIQSDGDYMFIYDLRVSINPRVPGPKSFLHIRYNGEKKYKWFASVFNTIRWDRPVMPDSADKAGMYIRGGLLNRIIVIGDYPPPHFNATIVHTYDSIDSPNA